MQNESVARTGCGQAKTGKKQKAGYFFEQEYIARFTQHFVEHCAILLCSSHSVNVGGITLRKDPDPQRMI